MTVDSTTGKHLTLRIPEALWLELQRVAEQNDRSLSAEARLALRAWLKGYDQEVAT